MFRVFGGAPKLLVPDNLKSGVNKAAFCDPEINRACGALAAHLRRLRSSGASVSAQGQSEGRGGRQIHPDLHLGRLRRLTFFSLAECDAAIGLDMRRMNERPMRNLGLSRRELFETIERDVLIALPAEDWEFAERRRARVNLDYHVEVHDFLYSVPHALIRAEVDLRVTARTVEVFHRGQRVGVHQRRYMGAKHATNPEHMPSSHQRYAEWTQQGFCRWAGKIGPNAEWVNFPELCLNLGDGVNQAANLASSTTSIPSRNLAPLTIFGNWF